MKLRIEKIMRKPVQTKYGQKTKIGVKSGGTWYSGFDNPLTSSWKEGMEVEVETKTHDYEGKTYHDLVFPRNGNANYGAELAEIKAGIKEILALLKKPEIDLEPPDEEEF